MAYIDTRGVNPTYINGILAVKLIGAPRDIQIDEVEFDLINQGVITAAQSDCYNESVINSGEVLREDDGLDDGAYEAREAYKARLNADMLDSIGEYIPADGLSNDD